MVFYPVEKFCSRFTDKLITINKEDYERAEKRFHAKETHYIPGVGIDLAKFQDVEVDRKAKRREIGVPEDTVLLLSVGELNENKNHQVIIRALAKLNNPSVHYAIAGVGEKQDYLLKLAKVLNVSERVHLLGYRTDLAQIYKTAEVFCFPSYREGLPVSLIEAVASGVAVVAACNRGTRDVVFSSENDNLCAPDDVDAFVNSILALLEQRKDSEIIPQKACQNVDCFSIENVLRALRGIYQV